MLHSRKFQLAVLDAVITIAIMWIGALMAPEEAEMVVATILAIQAPFVVLINGIAKEDAAQIAAGTHISQKE